MQIKKALELLNKELKTRKKSYTLYTLGGAALQLLGLISRDTSDIDIIAAKLDQPLVDAKNAVAKKLKISEDWLNNKVSPILERLPKNWKTHCVTVFDASHLTILSLSRADLIASKLHAAVDRFAEDFEDLVNLKPSLAELTLAKKYVMKQAGDNENYEAFVNGVLSRLKGALGI